MPTEKNVVVIGAGVLGLSTATLLQTKYPETQIIIVAAETPTTTSPSADYASMWAGAHYRPIPRSTRQLDDEAELGLRTSKVMKQIAKETPEAGVSLMKGVEYLENPDKAAVALKTGDIYAGPDDEFRVLEASQLPKGVKWGCEYISYCINVHIYCQWLLDKFLSKGGRLVQQRLSSASDAFQFAQERGIQNVLSLINCSGRNFDQDSKMKIIRGQTVLVKQQYDKTVTRQYADGRWAFLIPRPRGGGTIVGGSKEIGDLETRSRENTRQILLHQAVEVFPDFVDDVSKFEVVQDNVGRRPWREGGLRLEVERFANNRNIIHGYGAGGRGYEISWGTAQRLIELFDSVSPLTSNL